MSASAQLSPALPDAGGTRARRTPLVLLLALAVALSGLTVLAGKAEAVAPYPTYHPQSTCSPTPKKGTRYLAAWLQHRYHGSGSLGISRSCSASGVSEHKEGRAFDWALDANHKRDRRYARAFRHYLFSKHHHARAFRARRMGVMYLIWNDRIYSASSQYRSRPYLHSGCGTTRACSTTLRHRNHMHISLTWRGARARTGWFHYHMKRWHA